MTKISGMTLDYLTGLHNREELLEDFRSNNYVILAIVNIDSFHELNNCYGQEVGDKVLRFVGEKLQSIENSKVYRYYGDVFVVVIDYKKQNQSLIRKIFLDISKQISASEASSNLYITTTIGVSKGKTELIKKAELAFKIAKSNQKEIVIYRNSYEKLQEKLLERNQEISLVKLALLKGEIIPFYQPIVSNKNGNIVKFEALARINYQDKIFNPEIFIPVSKNMKIYHHITKSMIKKVFEDFKDKKEKVSINLSAEDIFNKTIVQFIEEEIRNYSNAANIVFEITESSNISNYKVLNSFITRIGEYGVKVSIDDFGAEYSNLSHISNVDTSYIKIDGQFIKDCFTNMKNRRIVESIAEIGKKLNIETVAEYVENEDIQKIIVDIGINYSQGYLFGKPMPIAEINKIVYKGE